MKDDHAAVEAMIGGFRDQWFRETPADPRSLDPARLKALRERLSDKFAYQWRATEANADLVDALYHTVTQTNGTRFGLCLAKTHLNERGEGPPLFIGANGWGRPLMSDEFQPHFYVTACSMNVLDFVGSYSEAVRLLGSLLPGWGFTLRHADGRSLVRLEKAMRKGPWIEAPGAALALVLATLEHLERAPDEAAPWRTI